MNKLRPDKPVSRISMARVAMFRLLAALLLVCCHSCSNVPDEIATDIDADGISDATEQSLGTDPYIADTDGDGLSDGDELNGTTSPMLVDSDGDGIADNDDTVNIASTEFDQLASVGNDLEPNNDFSNAVVPDQLNPDQLILTGRMNTEHDIDVYNIGPAQRGDRIEVTFDRVESDVQPAIALFDENGHAIRINRSESTSTLPSVVVLKHKVTETSGSCFVAFATIDDESETGRYRFTVDLHRNSASLLPSRQVVYLDFEGGALDTPILNTHRVAPLDAGAIDESYEQQSDYIKQLVTEAVRARFARFDVDILSSEEESAPDGPFTRISIGGNTAPAFGAAQRVDPYNASSCDDGIVFAEAFAPRTFGFTPPPEAIATAIGNVAAHEIGHLLGLYHVNDYTAIMDESSPAIVLLYPQHFTTAPLSQGVFPLGMQNSPKLLRESVGPR